MKKILSLLLILPLTIAVVMTVRGAETSSTSEPIAPWQMAGWNIFHNNPKSFKDIYDQYKGFFATSVAEPAIYEDQFLADILLAVHRLRLANPEMQKLHLPLYPDNSVMTFQLAAILLYPKESVPFAFAVEGGLFPADVKPNSYMSRQEFLDLLLKVFQPAESSDILTALKEAGITKHPDMWRDTSKNGFPMTHGVRLIINFVRAMEADILNDYRKNALKTELAPVALSLDDASLAVLYDALLREALESGVQGTPPSFDDVKVHFKADYAQPLTSVIADRIRSYVHHEKAPVAYTLPRSTSVGECALALSQKMTFPAITKAHANGSKISCEVAYGTVTIDFDPDSTLINLALPDMTHLMNKDMPEKKLFQLDFPYSTKHSIVLTPDGEMKVIVSFKGRPDVLTQYNYAGACAQDSQGKSLGCAYDLVDKDSITNTFPLRAFAGSEPTDASKGTTVKFYAFDEPHYRAVYN